MSSAATATSRSDAQPPDHQAPPPLAPVPSAEPRPPGGGAARAAAPEARAPAKPKAKLVLVGMLLLAGAGSGVFWLAGRGKESTDDAQVEGRIVNISARVPGQVERVLVRDNQEVKEGDILVVIDRRDLEARLAAAKADAAAARAQQAAAQAQLGLTQANAQAALRQARGGVEQASSNLTATRSSLQQASADVSAAEAAARLAEADLLRARDLRAQGTVPQAELDLRVSRAEQARAQLDQARAKVSTTQANLTASSGGVEVASGRLASAETAPLQVTAARAAVEAATARVDLTDAQQRLAELNLGYADVRAPVRGVVSRRTVEQGQLVDPSRPMLAIVGLPEVWVVANFKEDQIGRMQAGQKAVVHVDSFGRDLPARVDSLAGASGARFALLPPDNSSGNFIKVVQRVPVLLRFDPAPADLLLRPGLSVEVTVRTGE